ncbi:MAG: hypothetical protein NWF00_04880 [Candidatus Bathyarchaeota archaeon]|nr:hypothetical protein [Candidatus Bathyarchaeota archaeon]
MGWKTKKPTDTYTRIDLDVFKQELSTLGFQRHQANEIASWINLIAKTEPLFLSGKTPKTIKACLTYIGAQLYPEQKPNCTQHKLAKHYNISHSNRIQIAHKTYLKILQQTKPELTKLETDFRRKPTKTKQDYSPA